MMTVVRDAERREIIRVCDSDTLRSCRAARPEVPSSTGLASSSLSLHWQSRFLTICEQAGPITMGTMLRHVGVNTIQS